MVMYSIGAYIRFLICLIAWIGLLPAPSIAQQSPVLPADGVSRPVEFGKVIIPMENITSNLTSRISAGL